MESVATLQLFVNPFTAKPGLNGSLCEMMSGCFMTLSGSSAVPRSKVSVRGKRWREGKREGGRDRGREGGR